MSLSPEFMDRVLLLLVDQAISVGLFDGGREIDDPLYERLPIQFDAPEGDAVERFIQNNNELRFGIMASDHVLDGWAVYDSSGVLLASDTLSEPRNMKADDNPIFRAGMITITMP